MVTALDVNLLIGGFTMMTEPCTSCPQFLDALLNYDPGLSDLLNSGVLPDWLIPPVIEHVLSTDDDTCPPESCLLLSP